MYLYRGDMVKTRSGFRGIILDHAREANGNIKADGNGDYVWRVGATDSTKQVSEIELSSSALKPSRRCGHCGGYGHKRSTCDMSGKIAQNALATDQALRQWYKDQVAAAAGAASSTPEPQVTNSAPAATVDPLKQGRFKCWKAADKFLGIGREAMKNVWLEGPPATGKTSAGNFLGFGSETPACFSITMHNDMSVEELIGHFVPSETGQGFDKYEGPAVRAIREGKRLVFNELDRASDSVMSVLHNLLDDTDMSVVRFLDQEIRPGKGYHVVGTSNEKIESLDDALQSRFTYKIVIDVPHPQAIEALPEDLREPCLNSYALADSQPELLVTYRQWRDFGETREKVDDIEMAAEAIFGERWSSILDGLSLRKQGVDHG